jgi:pantoate--beta-alanine ligase
MRIVRTRADLRAALTAERTAARSIGFVPTMGAFHDGHLSLMQTSRPVDDVVVVSIFVNPLQFGPNEDFGAYPRDYDRDLSLARAEGVDLVFLPPVEEMYDEDRSTSVSVGRLAQVLEGEERPGHFDGVCTVVAKLFNLVRPDRAYFGQKDAQQVAVLKRMVRDLSFDVDVVVCPIVRASDGVALSSRNAYLSEDDRKAASVLYRALRDGEAVVASSGDVEAAEKTMWESMAAQMGVEPGYAAGVDPDTFGPPVPGHPVLLAVSARVGPARLIDNLLVDNPEAN